MCAMCARSLFLSHVCQPKRIQFQLMCVAQKHGQMDLFVGAHVFTRAHPIECQPSNFIRMKIERTRTPFPLIVIDKKNILIHARTQPDTHTHWGCIVYAAPSSYIHKCRIYALIYRRNRREKKYYIIFPFVQMRRTLVGTQTFATVFVLAF